VETRPVDRGYGNGARAKVTARVDPRPDRADGRTLTRNLSPPIGAQRLRGPGAVLRELVGNSVRSLGIRVNVTRPGYRATLRFDLLLELDQVLVASPSASEPSRCTPPTTTYPAPAGPPFGMAAPSHQM
jgi:hypothetical protein